MVYFKICHKIAYNEDLFILNNMMIFHEIIGCTVSDNNLMQFQYFVYSINYF